MRQKGPTFREALRFWVTLGFINFGGPAGQIALMDREVVERRRWLSRDEFLRALNFCMLLPGPEAQQLATYIGWRLHGIAGGIIAGACFVIPSVFVLLSLSWLAAAHADVPAIAGLFAGIQPVVIVIVAEAVLRIGRKALRHPALVGVAAAAFLMLRVFAVPFPIVIASAALAGLLIARWWPAAVEAAGPSPARAGAPLSHAEPRPVTLRFRLRQAFLITAVSVALWAVPVGALWFWRGGSDVLVQEALFFTQAAFVTFGGAYAVLSYIADAAVNAYGWLDTRQMVQGLGLAESTPGPLIMVTQYVGFLGAWKFHGDLSPLAAGVMGALVTTYVTFLPSIAFILVGAPLIEALAGARRFQAALTGVTAAVVGVILNLALFFGTHVIVRPDGVVDRFALVVAVVSWLLLWRVKVPVHLLVPLGGAVGMAWRFLA